MPVPSAVTETPVPVATAAWVERAPMPTSRTHAGRAVAGGRLYVVGGLLFQAGPSSAFERYDPSTDRWEALRPLPLRLDHAMAAATDEVVIVAGGSYASGTTRVLRHDIARNAWLEVAPLPEPLAAGGAVALDGMIYVIGGVSSGRTEGVSSAYAYDVRGDAWRRLIPMPTARHHLAVVAYRGEICALGGRGEPAGKAFECYVPRSDRWERRPSLPVAMEDFDAAVVGDELWTFPQRGGAHVFDGSAWQPRHGPPGVEFGHVAGYILPWLIVVNASSVTALKVR